MKTITKYYNIIFDNNKLTALLFFVIIILKVVHLLIDEGSSYLFNDGWYYSNIARSILAGHGFSNPFSVDTGPTAWVPPLFVYLIIPVFKFIGDNIIGYTFIVFIQIIGFSLSFYYLLKAWSLTKIVKNNFLILASYLFLLFSFQTHVFRMVNDLWIYLILFSLELYALINYIKNGKSFYLLILISVLIPLCAPIFAPGFVLIIALIFISAIGKKFNLRLLIILPVPPAFKFVHILWLGLFFNISLSIWTYRNYVVFDKLIFSKSNEWFEFYLSNVKDEDGILSESTVSKNHPDYNRDKFQAIIKAKGEIGWMTEYDKISHQYLDTHKLEYYRKLLNRGRNIFIFTEVDNDLIPCLLKDSLPRADKTILKDSLLIKGNYWVSLALSEADFKAKIKGISPANHDLIVKEWYNSKTKLHACRYSKKYLFLGLFIALIPLLSMIIIVIGYRKEEKAFLMIMASLYFIYSIPYIMISHELRYQEPLFGVQSLLISMMLTVVLTKMFGTLKHLNGISSQKKLAILVDEDRKVIEEEALYQIINKQQKMK